MPYLDDAKTSYYRHWEAPQPRALVVLLHGFGEHSGHYHRLAFALNKADLDVWGIDHAGHGLSGGDRGRFTSIAALAEQATQLLDLANSRAPNLPVAVVGHSLGGITAALMAAQGTPIDTLVLTGTPLDGLPVDVEPDPVMSLDSFYLDALETDPLGFDTAPAEAALWQAIGDCRSDLADRLRHVQIPTLFINGDRDVFASPDVADRWAATLPQAHVHTIPGGHHDIVNDLAHQEVADIITASITARLGSGTSRRRDPSAVTA